MTTPPLMPKSTIIVNDDHMIDLDFNNAPRQDEVEDCDDFFIEAELEPYRIIPERPLTSDSPPQCSLTPDKAMIERHMKIMFGYCEGYVPLRSFGESTDSSTHYGRVWSLNDGDLAQTAYHFAQGATRNRAACYVIPGTVREKNQARAADVYQMQTVLVDLDHGDIDAKRKYLTRHLGIPTLVVASGGVTAEGQQKLHIYWKLKQAYTSDDLNTIAKIRALIASKAGGDEHFKSLHQPIRVAGSIYHKNNTQKLVTIIEDNPHEHELVDLLEAANDMPYMEGEEPAPSQTSEGGNSNAAKFSIDELMVKIIRENGVDGITRFGASSQIMGYWLRLVHDGKLSMEEGIKRIMGHNEACLRPPRPHEDVRSDIKRLWNKHVEENGPPKALERPPQPPVLVSYSARVMLEAPAPIPTDLIGPRVLTPGGFWLIAGPPKIGKSDFVLNLLTHAAAGVNFLWFSFPKPLRVFYAQAEIEKPYLDERYLCILGRNRSVLEKGLDQLYMTSRFSFTFNEDGIEALINHIASVFPDSNNPVDIIAIDPFRNIYQSGLSGGDLNEDLMAFFRERLEGVLQRLNPKAAIILIHHTNKITSKMLLEDPMAAISGGGALLSYPTAISVLGHATDDDNGPLCLWTDLRNGPSIGARKLTKREGVWTEVDITDMRLVRQAWGEKNDREQVRKRLKILEFIYNEATEGRVYTAAALAGKLSQTYELGSDHSIRKYISNYEFKGFIRRFSNEAARSYGLIPARSPYGYLCVEGMGRAEHTDPKTGEVHAFVAYLPTHYRHHSDTILPLASDEVHRWVYDQSSDGED